MNQMKIALLFFTAFLFYCGDLPMAGGTGTGTNLGEGKLLGSVFLPDGTPGTGTAIVMREKYYIPYSKNSRFLRNAVVDSKGMFVIDSIDSGNYILEMKGDDSLFAVQNVTVGNMDSTIDIGKSELNRQIRYYGTLQLNDASTSGTRVLVLGMDRICTVGSDGTFSLLLPKSSYLFRIQPAGYDTSIDVFFSDVNSGDTIQLHTKPYTVLEDFDQQDDVNNLNALNNGGSWFWFTDEMEGGYSRFSPAIEAGIKGAIVFEEFSETHPTYNKNSLHLTFAINTRRNFHYGVIGTYLCDPFDSTQDSDNSWFDLSDMTALSFAAKGTGTIYVQFLCQYTDTDKILRQFLIETPVELTPAWTIHSVLPSHFSNVVLQGTSLTIPAATALTSVNCVRFFAKDRVELYLDEISIRNVKPETFRRKQ
jgi:hypothetical protein